MKGRNRWPDEIMQVQVGVNRNESGVCSAGKVRGCGQGGDCSKGRLGRKCGACGRDCGCEGLRYYRGCITGAVRED